MSPAAEARASRAPARGRVVAAALTIVFALAGAPARAQSPDPAAPADRDAQTVSSPAAPAEAGGVRIEARTDRKTVTIGDPITLTVRLVRPPDARVTAFDPERSLGDLTLLERRTPQTQTLPDGRLEETRVLRLTRYKLGESRIPSIEARFVDAAGKERTVATPPLVFAVGSILSAGDTRPADIKNPSVMAVRAIWPWVVGIVAAAALAAAWLWRRRARPVRPVAAAPAVPPRPPHEVAYAELQRLLSSGILEAGRVKEFYIELAEILRRYVAARFGVDTFERTTAEILEALRLARLPAKGMGLTSEFFGACDVVKFAKYLPSSEETRITVERAYRLIDETRSRETASERVLPAAAGAGR